MLLVEFRNFWLKLVVMKGCVETNYKGKFLAKSHSCPCFVIKKLKVHVMMNTNLCTWFYILLLYGLVIKDPSQGQSYRNPGYNTLNESLSPRKPVLKQQELYRGKYKRYSLLIILSRLVSPTDIC